MDSHRGNSKYSINVAGRHLGPRDYSGMGKQETKSVERHLSLAWMLESVQCLEAFHMLRKPLMMETEEC